MVITKYLKKIIIDISIRCVETMGTYIEKESIAPEGSCKTAWTTLFFNYCNRYIFSGRSKSFSQSQTGNTCARYYDISGHFESPKGDSVRFFNFESIHSSGIAIIIIRIAISVQSI